MKRHTWVIETIDGGHLGESYVWKCTTCGACGGPHLGEIPWRRNEKKQHRPHVEIARELEAWADYGQPSKPSEETLREAAAALRDPFGDEPPLMFGHPFLAGPAMALSVDCEAAEKQIRWWIDDQLWEMSGLASKGLSPKYAKALIEVLRLNKGRTDMTAIVSLTYDIRDHRRRPHLKDVLKKLADAGFRTDVSV